MEFTETSTSSKKKKYVSGRLEYLDQLVVEFQTTDSIDAKKQILANLSNFAFDPLNYDYFRQLNALDLFLDLLPGSEDTLTKFSIAGLCNLCLDPVNKDYINRNGLSKIINLLEHSNVDVALSTITTLMFLITPESKTEITSTEVIRTMLRLSKGSNARLKNLTAIFLEDYCSKEQIERALTCDISKIPLPKN